MRLHPTVPFIDGETPASFASRLAIANGVKLDDFCEDFKLSLRGLIRGKNESLDRLSELTGLDPETLAQAAWLSDRPFAYFRGHKFGLWDHCAEGSRACIQCLHDDHAAASDGTCICFRGEWRLACLHTCHIHDLQMVALPQTRDIHLLRDFPKRILAQWDSLTIPSLQRAPSALEIYVRARLYGLPHAPTPLDTFALPTVIASCNAIGASAVFGDKHLRSTITDDGRWEAGARGFQIASGGEDAIAAFLKELQPLSYGSLYKWFASAKAADADYDYFRELLTRHVEENVAFLTNAKLFGKPLTRRKVHTVLSASEELRISPDFIRRIVLARLPEAERTKKNGELTFKVDDFADEWPRIASALQLWELAPNVGCTLPIARILVSNGFIKPILPPVGDCPGVPRYAREDVNAFLEKLSARAEVVREAPAGAYPIAASYAKIPCSIRSVINLILGGELSWVGRVEGVHGLDGLLVDAREVRKKITGPATGELTVNQALRMMDVSARAFYTIAKVGLINVLPIPQQRNRAAVPRITTEEIIRFRKKYVTLTGAARQLSMHWSRVKPALVKAGIHAIDLGEVPLNLYEREQVARVFPSLNNTALHEIVNDRSPPRRSRWIVETTLPEGTKRYALRKKQSAISATSGTGASEPLVKNTTERRAPIR